MVPPPVLTVPTVTPTTRSNPVRLPKLQMKRFNGDLTRWMRFWQSAVNNDDLSGVEKFNYLISLLDGIAREALVLSRLITSVAMTLAPTFIDTSFNLTFASLTNGSMLDTRY